MKWSFRIARVAGIEVRIHVTFFLLLALYAWLYYEQGGTAAAVYGVGFVLLIFLCVLLHEFGHAFAARIFGIPTPDITLLPIGGVARLARIPNSPWQELIIALAGPAVNVAIALILFVLLGRVPGLPEFEVADRFGAGLMLQLLLVNLFLVGFNLIPAFPMDGGRVLRALLAMAMPHVTATKVAARVGQGVAVLFAVAAFTPWGDPLLFVIAIFVFGGAQQELAYVETRARLEKAHVQDVMQTSFITLPADLKAGQAGDFVIGANQEAFPLADELMHFKGLISREDLAKAVRELPPEEPVLNRAHVPPALRPGMTLHEAATLMQQLAEPVLPVLNASGQIVGLAVGRQA